MNDSIRHVLDGGRLSEDAAEEALCCLASGSAEPAVAGAFLVALRLRGETVEEIRGFARGMRALARKPRVPKTLHGRAVDVVGTGGDGSGSLNLSTGAALLTAAAGVPVLKHGNGSITSRSGSADVLRRLGVPADLEPDDVAGCLESSGFAFLFAPRFHPAMKRLAGVRRSLGVRTVFNLLGPLTNPAAPPFHVIGAWSEEVGRKMAECLSGLPIDRAFVVHGSPGWDEATPCGPFTLFDVRPGSVTREQRDPAALGLRRCRPEALIGGDPSRNAGALRSAFSGRPGAHRDALALGAALALEVTGTVPSPRDALAWAEETIDSGAALRLIDRLVGAAATAHPVRAAANG